jgi:hypothetical protein
LRSSPIRWLHGVPTSPQYNPRADGTRPTEFKRDLRRAIAAMEGIATANPHSLERAHGTFGTMSLVDWQRWVYKHTEHHLRPFGL